MRLLDRYVFRELIVPFLIGTVALVLMFQANALIAYLKEVRTANVPVLAIAQLLIYKTPDFLQLTLLGAVTLATSLGVTRLARESEITAMRVAGASIRRIVAPIAFFGLLVALLNFWMVETVRPKAEARFRQIANKVIYVAAAPDYAENTLLKTSTNSMIYFASARREKDGRTHVLDLLIVEHPKKGQMLVCNADESYLNLGVWRATKMYYRLFEGERLVQFYVKDEAIIDQKITVTDFFSQPQAPELDIAKLHQQIALDKSVGRDTRSMETELYTRFSIPFACVVLALSAPIFGIKFGRSGGFIGILLAALLIGGWFNLYVISTSIFARNGWFPPMLAAWFPNIVFMVFGLIGLRRLE